MKVHRLSTQLLTGKERMRAGREKLKLQVVIEARSMIQVYSGLDVIVVEKVAIKDALKIFTNSKTHGKVKAVGSKLREDGPRGARRAAWCLLASLLFYQGWSGYINTSTKNLSLIVEILLSWMDG